MGNRLRLAARVDERFCGAPVQNLPTALQEAVISGVPNQRMLEAIGRLWRDALDEKKIRADKTVQRGLECGLVESPVASLAKAHISVIDRNVRSHVAQKPIGKAPAQHRPNLGHFAGCSEPVKARRKRLPQGRRDRVYTPVFAALEKQ